jgi:hypothetical protein
VDRVSHAVTQAVAWRPVLGARDCFSHGGNSIKMQECLGIAVSIRTLAPEKRDSRNVAPKPLRDKSNIPIRPIGTWLACGFKMIWYDCSYEH